MPVCHLLPETMFGWDTDEIFAYTTLKSVWIRDRWVGFGFYCLLALIGMWVVFGQILWRNEHFQLKDVQGVPRIWFSHPTVDHCDPNDGSCHNNWTPASKLPYCSQYAGKEEVSGKPAECIYADKRSLMGLDSAGTEHKVFIPTQTVTFTEKKECEPSAANGHSCSNDYAKLDHPGIGYYEPSFIRYFADIENIRLQLTSSYHRDSIAGTSLEHKAMLEECRETRPSKTRLWHERIAAKSSPCDKTKTAFACAEGNQCEKVNTAHPEILGVDVKDMVEDGEKDFMRKADWGKKSLLAGGQRLRRSRLSHGALAALATSAGTAGTPQVASSKTGANASSYAGILVDVERLAEGPSDKAGFWATDWGDVLLLGKVLELAGVNLDTDFNLDKLSTRQAGTVIEIEAHYTNMIPFLSSLGYSPVSYYYTVQERPMPYVAREMMSLSQPHDYPHTRTYEVQHGILIVFSVSGTFGFFNIVYFFIMLTVATGLLGVATKVTDLLAIYVHPRRRNYFHLKYEVSPDFSDMWQCNICGFHNHPSHTECKGVEQWCSPEDEATRPCGAKRGALPEDAPATTES